MTPEEELFSRLHVAEAQKPTAPLGADEMQEMLRGDPDASAPVTLGTVFTHHDTHPIVIDFALLKAFGLDWLTWESETLWQEVHRIFKSQISEIARSKVQSIKTLHVSDLPWTKWQVFEKIIQGLNNNVPRWDIMQAPSLEQLYVGIDIMNQVRSVGFSDEVKLYIAGCVLNDEVCYVPPPLDFVQVEVARPKVVCLDCGNEDSALYHDGVCDTCSGKFLPEQGLSMKPDPERVAMGKGTNTKIVPTFDPDPVHKRWGEVGRSAMSDVHLEESQVDVQVGKLLVARDYMNLRRRQLADQLTTLKSWLGAPA